MKMLGPYKTNGKEVNYRGNKIFAPIRDILNKGYTIQECEERVDSFINNDYWGNIARINHQIAKTTNEFFNKFGAIFTLLPLTTRMISSPGAVYGREAINYTTDTCPITLKWFDMPQNAFLSESSQIYLELALLQKDINHVYSIYNSFRKEKADATHLSEFHHIEYEGKVNQVKNSEIAFGLVKKIISDLLKNNMLDLKFFLNQ
ncbi:asparagine--tRNA ligase, partial [Candidatus Woesearchaeota archaeon]|nr:asparagine--tRNA ligase [Candidatus Woesearchaeota archaeon]